MWKMSQADGSVISGNDEVDAHSVTDEESGSSSNSLESRIRKMIRDSERRMQAKIDKLESVVMEPSILNRFNMPDSTENYDDADQWQSIGTKPGAGAEAPEYEMNKRSFKFAEDVYAILVSSQWNSSPFYFALIVIFAFQTSLSILLLADQIDWSGENPMMLPANVKLTVRLSQALAIFIALFSQADLLQGIETLFNGVPSHFKGPDDRFANITTTHWNVTCIIRIVQGSLNLFAAFVLLIQSETVFDVLLNFLGVAFVSDLDDMAFGLSATGYFGSKVRKYALSQRQTDFYQEGRREGMVQIVICQKKILHIFTSLFILVIMFFFYFYFLGQQIAGVYSVQDMQVEFGDEVIPFMGLFNGCYQVHSSSVGNDRLIYRQVGFEDQGGKFGYCDDVDDGEGGWTFYIGDLRNPCDEWLIRSWGTETFDVLEATASKWYTADGLPMDYLEANEVENVASGCGKSMFEATSDSCETVNLADSENAEESTFFGSLKVDENFASRETIPHALSHPVYYDLTSGEERTDFSLALFTGRRWVITDSARISGLRDIANLTVEDLEDFFYRQDGFSVLNQDADWVEYISEVVEVANDEGTPLRLQWYFPRLETNATLNFPSADLARPIDPVFVCVFCNALTNPCFHEGLCNDETGFCNCAHGAAGPLCQERPLGDGRCNEYFNNDENDYDGGDCCGGTCEACVGHQMLTPFGIDFKHNATRLQGTDPLGYDNCIDPSFATFTLNVRPHRLFDDETNQTFFEFPSINVECDDYVHMQSPTFKYAEEGDVPKGFAERIRIPHGVSCTLLYSTFQRGTSVFLTFNEQDQPFRTAVVPEVPVQWDVPKSQCVLDLFASQASNFVSLDDLTFVGNDALSDNMCRRLQQDSTNVDAHDKLFERYAVGILLSAFIDTEEGDLSIPIDWDHCNGWTSDTFTVDCDESGRKVLGLTISPTRVPSSEIKLFDNLKHLSNLESFSLDNSAGLNEMILREPPSGIWSLSKLTSLKLHEIGLFDLPESIGKLGALQHLNLRGNKLESLPDEIGSLYALQHLDLDSNLIASLPTTIGLNLTSLISFSIRSNGLVALPSSIGKMSMLRSLHLEFNALTSLPVEVSNLEALTSLDLFSNALTNLPVEFGKNLGALESLNMHSNKLSSLPDSIGNMAQLSVLRLTDNQLSLIPTSVGNLRSLTYLSLDSNILTALPSEVGNLESLIYLNVSENALSYSEVLVIENTTVIMNSTIGNTTDGNLIDGSSTEGNFTMGNLTAGNLTGPRDLTLFTYVIENYTAVVSSLPSEIGRLSSMLTLDLSLNDLVLLPTEIGSLGALELLDISSNMLTDVPSELGNLQSLQYLNLTANALSSREYHVLRNVTVVNCMMDNSTDAQDGFGMNSTTTGNFTMDNSTDAQDGCVNATITSVTMNFTVANSSIPSELGRLPSMVTFDLSFNDLAVLPSELGMLTSLKLLDLSSNVLSGLPTELANLQSLEFLNLAVNELSSQEVVVVHNLTNSDLLVGIPTDDLFGSNATNYTVVVSSVPRLSPSLRILDLSLNELAVLPAGIGSLVALEWLSVNSNQLSKLPSEVGSLESLVRLDLRNNTLSSLPTEVGDLAKLASLDVSRNVLSDLPDDISNLPELIHLDVSYNEMVASWSPESIEISRVVANLETCLSDSEFGISSCQLFCCRLESSFCSSICD